MIKAGGETVLLYNLNNEKGRKIRFLLVRLGMRIRVVEKEDYGKPIGELAGMKGVTLEDENAAVEDFHLPARNAKRRNRARGFEGDFDTDELPLEFLAALSGNPGRTSDNGRR